MPRYGRFGTYGLPVRTVLEPILARIAHEIPNQPFLLMGRGSREFREHVIERYPAWEKNLHATGLLAADDLSHHLAACDLMIQPYPDGATTRRGSLMAGISHGKVILTTSSSVMEPLWAQSAAVGLTPAGDADAYMQLLRELTGNAAERTRMSHAAQKLYQERFDISHTVAALHLTPAERVPCAS
jgi:glycosyltransferase involved in cell wall biosynthesis